MVGTKQCIYFEKAIAYCEHMLKTHVATSRFCILLAYFGREITLAKVIKISYSYLHWAAENKFINRIRQHFIRISIWKYWVTYLMSVFVRCYKFIVVISIEQMVSLNYNTQNYILAYNFKCYYSIILLYITVHSNSKSIR